MPEVSTPKTTIRAACYCRISSDPKDKREGVTRQREDTAALCEVKGWQVAEVYIDNDRSASNGKTRPEWERLLADVEAGKIDAVAAWDQDRVNRMMDDFQRYKKVFVRRGVLLATSNNGDIDLSTPSGVLTATIKTAVSEHEVSMMKVRMRRAARQKAEQGRPQWRRAFGYLDTPAGPIPNPEVAPLVRDAYAAIQAGSSLKDVARMWNDAGALTEDWRRRRDDDGETVIDPVTGKPAMVCTCKPWNESLVSQFLRKPRNAGLRNHGDEIIGKGTWEPLVDEPLWRAVQATMNGRAGSLLGQRRAARRHLLTGVIFCGKCDHHLAGQWVMRKTGGKPGRPKAGQKKEPHPGDIAHVITYSCKGCRGVSIRADDVEPFLLDVIGGRLALPDAVDLLKADVHDAAEAEKIRTEKATLYGRLDELAVERAQGLMNGRQLQIASEVIQQQIDALERKEQDQERLRVFDGIPLGTPEAVKAVKGLSQDRFRAVLSVLCKVTIVPVGKGSHGWQPERVRVTPL
jgi:DNA invertase Pin-like site-specific DNA recombinase